MSDSAERTDGRYPKAVEKAEPIREAASLPAHHYEPNEKEQAVLDAHAARKEAAPPRTKLKVTSTGDRQAEIRIDHESDRHGAALVEASFGTTDWQVAEALCGHLAQLANVNGAVDNAKFQHAMALAQGVQPKDEVEAMLATQMAAIHLATMDYAGKLHRCTSPQVGESYERSLTRLSRTFAAQVDTLKKYRSKGEQRVVVEHQHVHVYPGGQAVVGTLNQGVVAPGAEGVETENQEQSHEREQLLLPERPSVLGTVEALGLSVQGTGRARQGSVPVPRRARRSAIRAA